MKSVDNSLSEVLMELSAKALITWMTHSAQRDISREELLTRGADFISALHANLILLHDLLLETMEDIQEQSTEIEARLDELAQRFGMLSSNIQQSLNKQQHPDGQSSSG